MNILHRMHKQGLLDREEQRDGSQAREYYTATVQGKQELQQVQCLIRKLAREVGEEAMPQLPENAEAEVAAGGADVC